MNYSVNSIILQILIQTISTADLWIKLIGLLAQRAKGLMPTVNLRFNRVN